MTYKNVSVHFGNGSPSRLHLWQLKLAIWKMLKSLGRQCYQVQLRNVTWFHQEMFAKISLFNLNKKIWHFTQILNTKYKNGFLNCTLHVVNCAIWAFFKSVFPEGRTDVGTNSVYVMDVNIGGESSFDCLTSKSCLSCLKLSNTNIVWTKHY